MSLDVASYEFTALIAPGSIVVLAVAFTLRGSFHGIEAPLLIACGIVGAYVVGHLLAAVGNICEAAWRRLTGFVWNPTRFATDAQSVLLQSRLTSANIPLTGKATEKQMRLRIPRDDRERSDTFNALHNLSRSLAVAFTVVLGMCIANGQVAAAVCSVIALALAIYRVFRFANIYSAELTQQFLVSTGDSPALRG